MLLISAVLFQNDWLLEEPIQIFPSFLSLIWNIYLYSTNFQLWCSKTLHKQLVLKNLKLDLKVFSCLLLLERKRFIWNQADKLCMLYVFQDGWNKIVFLPSVMCMCLKRATLMTADLVFVFCTVLSYVFVCVCHWVEVGLELLKLWSVRILWYVAGNSWYLFLSTTAARMLVMSK